MHVLLLGGTTEASLLAKRLAGDDRFAVTLSLAGRTQKPVAQPLDTRVGGFGGVQGLAEWLHANGIRAVLDATHPYAARISANTRSACATAGVALGSVVRPPWQRQSADTWIDVGSADEAVQAVGTSPRNVFLALGRLELAAFASAPQHRYVVRSIDPPKDISLPPELRLILARGPFEIERERALLAAEKISVIVCKNSGGPATYAKIAAAREQRIPVVMIRRPEKPIGHPVHTIDQAIDWLETVRAHDRAPGSLRGV